MPPPSLPPPLPTCVLQIGLVLLRSPDWASLTDSTRDGDITETWVWNESNQIETSWSPGTRRIAPPYLVHLRSGAYYLASMLEKKHPEWALKGIDPDSSNSKTGKQAHWSILGDSITLPGVPLYATQTNICKAALLFEQLSLWLTRDLLPLISGSGHCISSLSLGHWKGHWKLCWKTSVAIWIARLPGDFVMTVLTPLRLFFFFFFF